MSRSKKKHSKAKSRPSQPGKPALTPSTGEAPTLPTEAPVRRAEKTYIIPIISISMVFLQIGLLGGLTQSMRHALRIENWQMWYMLGGMVAVAALSAIVYPNYSKRREPKFLTAGLLLWGLTGYMTSLAITLTDAGIAFLIFGGISITLVIGPASRLVYFEVNNWVVKLGIATIPLVCLILGAAIGSTWQNVFDWRWVGRASVLLSILLAMAVWWIFGRRDSLL